MTTIDPREARQPQWIRNTLFQLRMRLGEAERRIAELTEGPADADTIAAPYGSYPLRLKRGESIEFWLGSDPDEFVRVRVLRDSSGRATLDLNAGTGISVLPRASNAIEIEIRGR
jgi:hypothetical protein